MALPQALNGTWAWSGTSYSDPLWTSPDGLYQYATWVSPTGTPVIGKRAHGSSVWTTYDLSAVTGNPLGSPVAADSHNVLAVAVDELGYVWVAGNMHSGAMRVVRSTNPGDITAWASRTMIGTQETSSTYPMFVRRSDGRLLFLYRDGVSGAGDYYINLLTASTGAWTRLSQLLNGSVSSESPYVNRVAVGSTGKIALFFTWRGTGNASTTNDVCYAQSTDGGATWTKADGTGYTLPVTHATAELVVDTAASGSGLLNTNGASVDSLGRPHAGFLFYDGSNFTQVHHVWHDGTTWHNDTVTAWTARMETNVSIIDASVARPAVVSVGTRTWMIVRSAADGLDRPTLIEVTDGTAGTVTVLDRDGYPEWEPTFDYEAARLRSELHLLPLFVRQNGPRSSDQTDLMTSRIGRLLIVDLTAL